MTWFHVLLKKKNDHMSSSIFCEDVLITNLIVYMMQEGTFNQNFFDNIAMGGFALLSLGLDTNICYPSPTRYPIRIRFEKKYM